MTFEYTDPDGDRLTIHGMSDDDGRPVAHFGTSSQDGVYVDVDRLEEVLAGIRDAARQAAGQPATAVEPLAIPRDTAQTLHTALGELLTPATAGLPDPTTADDPTPLRWGLNDVLYGDDDTITVCLSGPDREPYWLELDRERAAVLRDDLAGPDRTEPQDHPGAELYTQLRRAGNDHDTTNRLIYAHARMAIRQHEALPDAGPAGGQQDATQTTTDEPVFQPVDPTLAARQDIEVLMQRGPIVGAEVGRLLDAYRAAILHGAADALDADMERFFAEWPDEPRNSSYANARKDAVALLRRLAAGAGS